MSAVARPSARLHLPVGDRDTQVVAAAAAAVMLVGAAAVYSPKYAVAATIGAGLVALAFWRLALGVAAFTVLTFPEHLPGSLGAGATVAKPLGVVLAVAWAAAVLARRGSGSLLARDQPAIVWAVSALIVLAASSSLWATDFSQTRYQLQRLVLAAALLLVVYTATSTSAAFRTVIWAFLIGSVVTAGYSIATGSYGHGRLGGIFDPNYFSAELIPAIVVSCFLLLTTTSVRIRAAAAVVLAVDTLGFALTQSRGGIVGLAVGLVAAVVLAGRARPRVLAAVLVLCAIAIGYYLAYSPSHLRGSFSGSVATSSSGRSDEWRIALRMLRNHPLNGVGLGNYVVVEPSYATQSINLNFVRLVVTRPLVAHNSYLEVAAELGLGGIALFVTVLGLALRRAGRALASLATSPDNLEFYARGLLAGALGMFVAYAFLSGQYEKQLWLVLGLVASIPAVAQGYEATKSARQTS
jgi:putative inorganic carbon (HCO3(-)) transporter